ncbi:NFACT RNA binding domain-containing protein [Bacillaceae bacterium]
MAYDGIVTRAVVHELSARCANGKIAKIYQPTPSDILLVVRAHGQTRKLLLSANPALPRVHITAQSFANPLEPPMFCMLLRKHCEGALIERIAQVGLERIIHIDLRATDELGEPSVKRLIVEIMGRHSNIILVDPKTNRILDGIHHVTPAISRYRQVLPGREYVSPPDQGKLDPLTVTKEKFLAVLDFNRGKLDRQLVDRFAGISPLLGQEILHRAGLPDRDNLWRAFREMMGTVASHRYTPNIVKTAQKTHFSAVPLTHLQAEETHVFPSVSECLDAYFGEKAERDAVRQKVQDLVRLLANERGKNEKKIQKLLETKEEAKKADVFKLWGELLTAHLHLLKRGDTQAEVVNYYEENAPTIVIPLDPAKTPAENAQAYFKKYNKAKNSLAVVDEQLKKAEEEKLYLDTLLQQLEDATLQDVEEIREELAEQGYLRKRGKKDSRRKKDQPQIEQYTSSDGIRICVGKNNKQNEYLTHRLAAPTDIWLHAKDIPGSHVVIRAKNPPETTIREAAMLAAYFSKAKHSSQVPVDYTLVKHVRKPNGARPGFVIYEKQKTLYVTPDAKRVQEMKNRG